MLRISIIKTLLFTTALCGVLSTTSAEKPTVISAIVEDVDTAERKLNLNTLAYLSGSERPLPDTLTVRVQPGDVRVGYKGQHIRGVLRLEESDYYLHSIWPYQTKGSTQMDEINNRLRRDTLARGRKAYRAVGEFWPKFALFNQNGEQVRDSTFLGQKVVLNFIFTRCMEARMCPAATARLVRLQREAKEAGVDGFHILSISFDPEFDTPGVLNEYGTQRGIDFDNFSLLTGDAQAIKDLMKQFGILIVSEEGTLNHTMATLLIDEKGKILYRRDGSRWSTRKFLDRLSQ